MKRGILAENKGEVPSSISLNLKKNLDALDVFINNISDKYSISFDEVISMLKKKDEDFFEIPSFILRDENLGILEAVTKYLKEEFGLTYHKIAKLLNRDDRVVWVTYNKASKKKKEKFSVGEPNIMIPVFVFSNTFFGPLESLSKYLVEEKKMDFISISKLLKRDNRSIWACYHRSKSKSLLTK
ncbi:MAG TPA: hypothetical protein VI564_07855 [Candidatus Nanoarchaeia archaeon]|nr:hypothetical protein [Candidatus Nanoarchaeia archaeon]